MIVAVTGIILILFVVGHLLGNLQIFLGPDWINGYSQHLRDLGPLLWLIRIVLLATVLTHIYFTILLAIENRRARPEPYVDGDYVKASWASRHMVVSGLVVLAFIIFHLLHFTARKFNPQFPLLSAGLLLARKSDARLANATFLSKKMRANLSCAAVSRFLLMKGLSSLKTS